LRIIGLPPNIFGFTVIRLKGLVRAYPTSLNGIISQLSFHLKLGS
jgi:hypothetical protein